MSLGQAASPATPSAVHLKEVQGLVGSTEGDATLLLVPARFGSAKQRAAPEPKPPPPTPSLTCWLTIPVVVSAVGPFAGITADAAVPPCGL